MPVYVKILRKGLAKVFSKTFEKIDKPDNSELYKEKFFSIASKIQEHYGFSKKKAFKQTKQYLEKYKTADLTKKTYKRVIPDKVIEYIKEVSP